VCLPFPRSFPRFLTKLFHTIQGHEERNDYGPEALKEGIEFWDAIQVRLGLSLSSLNEDERDRRIEDLRMMREPPVA
jgi:hypothetical protein